MKVRDVVRMLLADGWFEARTRGSHRQFKHPKKSGLATVPGRPNDDLAPGNAEHYSQASRPKATVIHMRYAIVIERANDNFSAYAPDLPGCVATGTTLEETEQAIREAIEFHIEGLREDGAPVPPPTSRVDYIEVAA
jgi:predicted RNase H-like HicB family nuclease/predicted RNA binding protein YcfA (HicA-like mRNA interferase family)